MSRLDFTDLKVPCPLSGSAKSRVLLCCSARQRLHWPQGGTREHQLGGPSAYSTSRGWEWTMLTARGRRKLVHLPVERSMGDVSMKLTNTQCTEATLQQGCTHKGAPGSETRGMADYVPVGCQALHRAMQTPCNNSASTRSQSQAPTFASHMY